MVSIIVPTCTEGHLLPLLESIEKYTDLTNVEIIIVANGYDGEIIAIPGSSTKVVECEERIGYTKAINEGIKVSKGDKIVLLNDDVVLLPQEKNHWLKRLVEPLKDNIGLTAPLFLWSPSAGRNFAVFFCVAFTRSIYDKVGGLDEIFSPGYGEDTDFCAKVEQLGYKCLQITQYIQKDGMNVGEYPIYHIAEGTFGIKPEWEEIKRRNEKVLHDRYVLAPGWFYGQDIEEYRRLVEDVPHGGTICELGCYKGRSLSSVADIIKRKNLNVYVVDIFTGTKSEGNFEPNYRKEFEENMERFGILNRVIILEGTTDKIVKEMPDGLFSLLFIDADHQYEQVVRDIINWLPKVKGTIAGHDLGSHEGVGKAVNELFINYRVGGSIWSHRV